MLQVEEPLNFYLFDGDQLQESQTRLERRKKKPINLGTTSSIPKSYIDLLEQHRFVCFFMVQGGGKGNYYSTHTLALRKQLALKFHNHMTIFVVFCGQQDSQAESSFCQGTGFVSFPSSSTLMSILNVTQVPSLAILDTTNGRPISSDAGLALEWNSNKGDPQELLDAWEQQQSGLSATQKAFSVVTLQSNCTIS